MTTLMESEALQAIVKLFDSSPSKWDHHEAWDLAHSFKADTPALLTEILPRLKKWPSRASVLRYVGRFSRDDHHAFAIGLAALGDRSWIVRHQACALLAYSLRDDALAPLNRLLSHSDPRTRADAKAAIDAISQRNHNFFKDRDHSGRVLWDYSTV